MDRIINKDIIRIVDLPETGWTVYFQLVWPDLMLLICCVSDDS